MIDTGLVCITCQPHHALLNDWFRRRRAVEHWLDEQGLDHASWHWNILDQICVPAGPEATALRLKFGCATGSVQT